MEGLQSIIHLLTAWKSVKTYIASYLWELRRYLPFPSKCDNISQLGRQKKRFVVFQITPTARTNEDSFPWVE